MYSQALYTGTTRRNQRRSSIRKLLRSTATHIDIGILLAAALVAFEIFNFSTTRYALANLLGDVSFATIRWATILAIAFCAIDFAGLLRFFSLGQGDGNRLEAWYLMGAWLLGATMSAFLAWWAVSITLLNGAIGLGFLNQLSLFENLPFVVAGLIWLTRLLFIGAFGIAAGYLFGSADRQPYGV